MYAGAGFAECDGACFARACAGAGVGMYAANGEEDNNAGCRVCVRVAGCCLGAAAGGLGVSKIVACVFFSYVSEAEV